MIRIDVAGQLAIKQRIQLLTMPPATRRKLLGRIGREIKRTTKRNLRGQYDVDGKKWAARKNNDPKKMLRKIGKHLKHTVSDSATTITFNNTVIGGIARAQQEGVRETMTASRMRRINGQPNYTAAATRPQAKALRAAGFKIRRANGKGWKAATLSYITGHFSQGQAGLILRILRDNATAATKTSWALPGTPRAFLGANREQINTMVQTIFTQLTTPQTA